MRFQEVYKKLAEKQFFVFSFEDLTVFYPKENRGSLRQYLSRWKKSGWIASLRKGLYELTYPKDHNIPDFFIANKLYAPSYVSLETALSYYSILPEVSMAVVSISPKITRRFKNSHGLFIYHSVQPEAFRGVGIEKHGGLDILIAEPEKALVDFIYFKTRRAGKLDLDAERLDKKKVAGFNTKKLDTYARAYGLDLKKILYA